MWARNNRSGVVLYVYIAAISGFVVGRTTETTTASLWVTGSTQCRGAIPHWCRLTGTVKPLVITCVHTRWSWARLLSWTVPQEHCNTSRVAHCAVQNDLTDSLQPVAGQNMSRLFVLVGRFSSLQTNGTAVQMEPSWEHLLLQNPPDTPSGIQVFWLLWSRVVNQSRTVGNPPLIYID